ncbi:hypothetical protein HPB48_022055 [Haemaphysalis longicornis]|uniref:Uncharacterized protein n=1 Tax=Haemaphysalis longicornis TaxID=44386 RepID=A0A9J6FZ44_HAELO|nr:hypothetical protein HPB48_022055 [Haemaphysalis longicornis]
MPSRKIRLLSTPPASPNSGMADNVCEPVSPNLLHPRSPGLNPLEYYVWGVIEGQVNKGPHNTKGSLKAAISHSIANISKQHMIRACSHL